MKKVTLSLILLVSLAFLFSCASAAPAEPVQPAPAQPAPVVQPAPAQPAPEPVVQPAPPDDPPPTLKETYTNYESDLILEGAQRYTVVRGDILSAVAGRYFGSDNIYYFPLIMLASKDVVVDPDLIRPGMNLVIPDLQRNLNDAGVRQRIRSLLTDIAAVYEGKGQPAARDRLIQLAQSLQ
jgi:nucleoid-associated protein YgaU